jgi:hypothetical protein
MKTKIVLWGANAQDERLLIALQLRTAENKVSIWTFPDANVTTEFSDTMLNEWRNNPTAEIDFPEGAIHIERDLSVADTLLPHDLKADKPELITRAQTEWQFAVLSDKLQAAYKSELAQLEDTVGQLSDYSADVWENLKGFWGKVQEQVRDKNLYREHADILRDGTNLLFDKLKGLRSDLNQAFDDNSKTVHGQFNTILDEIEAKIQSGINRFPHIFEDLKKTQSSFKDSKMKREHANEIWNRLDGLFKAAKEKRFGGSPAGAGSSPENKTDFASQEDRLKSRLDGLLGALDKMQYSLDRDQEDLDYQNTRVNNATGQLESQLRQARINVIVERMRSKEEKLKGMLETKLEIETKMAGLKERQERQAANEEKEAKKAAEKLAQKAAEKPAPPVAETVKEEIQKAPEVVEVVADKIETVETATPIVENAEAVEAASVAAAAINVVDKM